VHRPVHTKRHVINAILYLNKTGAQWRMLASQSGQCYSIAV
jgi:transposase